MALAFLKLLLVALASAAALHFEVENRSKQTIWVGAMGKGNLPAPNGGGFELPAGGKEIVDVAEGWEGHFWARTGCKFDGNGQGLCETGACGQKLKCDGAYGSAPLTLAEFRNGESKGQVLYDISNVYGFNFPTAIEPIDVQDGGDRYTCTRAACTTDINSQCLVQLSYKVGGRTVGCKSACIAFYESRYCCRAPYNNSPETCRPEEWPLNYAAVFKRWCPNAFSYAYDNQTSTFNCENTNYRVIFG